MSQDIVLYGTVVYPKFFQPKPVQVGGQPKGDPIYSCQLIVDMNSDWAAINAALAEAVAYKFGAQVQLTEIPQPWHDATSYGLPGQFFTNITASQDKPPEVYDEGVQRLAVGTDGADIRGGHRVALYCRAGGYLVGNTRGVKFYMNKVQFLDRNPNLPVLGNTGPDATEVFQPVAGAPAQLAPTAYSQPAGAAQPGTAMAPPAGPGAVVQQPVQPAAGAPVPGNVPGPAAPPAGAPAVQAGPSVAAQPAAGYPSNPPASNPMMAPGPTAAPGPGMPGPGAPAMAAPGPGPAAAPAQPGPAAPAQPGPAGYPYQQ